MDENTRKALHHSQVIDLTTTGRRTGQPRTIEIFLHAQHGLLFISGIPRADLTADIPATGRVVTDPTERRPLMEAAAQRWGRHDVDEMVRHSPLIVLTVLDADEEANVL